MNDDDYDWHLDENNDDVMIDDNSPKHLSEDKMMVKSNH